MLVFIRMLLQVSNVQVHKEATGVGNIMGNKGAVFPRGSPRMPTR